MRALDIFSAAMSRVGKSLSDLEDIAARLGSAPGRERRPYDTYAEPRLDQFDAGPVPPSNADAYEEALKDLPRFEDHKPIIVGKRVGTYQGAPVFDTKPYYTTTRDFAVDEDGYLVDDEGYVLMGRGEGDDHTQDASVLRLDAVRLPHPEVLPAQPTGWIGYRGNLPKTPMTALAVNGPASTLLDISGFSCNPTASGNGSVIGYDVARFLDQSLAGGAVIALDETSAPVIVMFRWAKIDSAQVGEQDVWNLFYRVQSAAERGTVAWRNVGKDFAFNALGRLAEPVECQLRAVSIEGHRLGDIQLDFGLDALTQFDDASGLIKLAGIAHDGYVEGELTDITISRSGHIIASYANGQSIMLAKAVFADPAIHSVPLRVAA